MVLATDLPGKLDFRWYSYNAHDVTLTWPTSLAGRTFEVRLDGVEEPIEVTVDGPVASFTVPAITVATLHQPWALVETTSADVTQIGGVIYWGAAYDDTDTTAVTVTAGTATEVTVNATSALTTLDGGTP